MKTLQFISFFFLALMIISSCQLKDDSLNNLANVAEPFGSGRGQWIEALNDGQIPAEPLSRQMVGRLRGSRSQYVQYLWEQPITTSQIALYLWDYNNEVPLPDAYTISYWDGDRFVPVRSVSRQQMLNNQFDTITFDKVTTTILRLEADTALMFPANILEWEVHQHPGSPDHPPIAIAGVDRHVMVNGKTYLSGEASSAGTLRRVMWKKESGPGRVRFEDANALVTTATFSVPGDYVLELTVRDESLESSSQLKVSVRNLPEGEPLAVVHTTPYRVDNPLWEDRLRSIIVNWIPHSINMINTPAPEVRTGGIDNFIEAAKALRGEPHGRHIGFVFSNAWVFQIIESMSLALMVDSKGDREIIAAQELMKKTLEEWIPIILAAQEPDGYIHTAWTLRDPDQTFPAGGRGPWERRWQPEHRRNHEGYVAGYFIEAAIAHHTYTQGRDTRLYDAAKRLAECWLENIGPGKIYWWDGHQGLEMALIRFAHYVNKIEGPGIGDRYIELAKFLLDNRQGGTEYDQSHVPVQQQYEAVGHAVRAIYSYTGMAGIAAETGDIDYHSAIKSLWYNIVNKKYYITGGIGSGETAEGFGENFSLPHNAYCEACSSCGVMFFQHTMNAIYHDAKYIDLLEETLYNALLGTTDLEGKNFYYPNPLTTRHLRYPWHNCPCCIGNIPRTLLMLPKWKYQKSDDAIYVNLFIGGAVNIVDVAGTDVEMVQKTDYPWSGNISIIVNPERSAEFTVYVRIPNRTTSKLYDPEPEVSGFTSFRLNNQPYQPTLQMGYAVVNRRWEKGDRIDMELPMNVQRITSDERVEANRGMIALRYGPLVFNVERYDNQDIDLPIGDAPLSTEWREDLLNGVMVIRGQWADGSPLLAIPNYARTNRVDRGEGESPVYSRVWIRKQ